MAAAAAQVTNIYRAAQYNIACCYSQIGQVDAGLEALQVAMSVGFDDYKKIRTDPSLGPLQKDERFDSVMNKARVSRAQGAGRGRQRARGGVRAQAGGVLRGAAAWRGSLMSPSSTSAC